MSIVAADPAAAAAEAGQVSRRWGRGYARYAGGKVLGALGSLVFMLVVNFFLFRVLPGDPARTMGRGRLSTPEQLAADPEDVHPLPFADRHRGVEDHDPDLAPLAQVAGVSGLRLGHPEEVAVVRGVGVVDG